MDVKITQSHVGNDDDPKVSFKQFADKQTFVVKVEGENHVLAEISGYDLKVGFNLEYIKSTADVELAIEGISNIFRQMIMDTLLSANKPTE